LGQADRQLKYVIDEGLLAYERHPIDDLLNNLLYYVARSSQAGERISEIRAAFNLAELLPGDEQVESAREALSAPSAKLMETVGSAIREDLGRVKDVLDIFVRTGMNKSSELVPQLELLKKISDTLGVLGLGELRGDIDGEIDRLKSVVELGGVANDHIILDIASTLLRVEDRLEQQLIRLTMPAPVDIEKDRPEDEEEFRKVAESVMRECIINLARIKETISQSLAAQAPSAGLDNVPSLINGIKSGLLMLEKPRAMEVVDRIGSLVSAMLGAGGPIGLTQKETDRLPTPSSASSTTWRRSRPDAASPGTCSTTRKPASPFCAMSNSACGRRGSRSRKGRPSRRRDSKHWMSRRWVSARLPRRGTRPSWTSRRCRRRKSWRCPLSRRTPSTSIRSSSRSLSRRPSRKSHRSNDTSRRGPQRPTTWRCS
ncbi:MAG: hypothetical protein OEY37_08550, partial [Gammaproteobacteria bacterium]|nr:hypothetical protein [Gammaproteobacteria bacterium]